MTLKPNLPDYGPGDDHQSGLTIRALMHWFTRVTGPNFEHTAQNSSFTKYKFVQVKLIVQ